MKNIILTSCGIINNNIKAEFYQLLKKEPSKIKLLYITTASDIEEDKSWMNTEYKTILDLGIKAENITEYKIGNSSTNIDNYDIMYMMGGNTFYLLDMIRKYNFSQEIIKFINNNKIYIGSSAGSEILGSSIEPALGYDDNNVGMTDYQGLKIIDGLIIPHANRKKEFIESLKNTTKENIILLSDGDGIIY